MAAKASTAVTRAMYRSWPVPGRLRERTQALPVSLTWRFTSAEVSRKRSITAALADDGLGERFSLEIDRLVVGILEVSGGVGELAHQAHPDQATMGGLLGARLDGPGRLGTLGPTPWRGHL